MTVKQKLQSADLRVTPGRELVLTMISRAKKPVSIQDIQHDPEVKKLHLDEVSIYRITKALTEKGILRHIDFHEGKFRYELNDDHHHHIVCTQCGSVKDIDFCLDENINSEISSQTGFQVGSHALEFFGLCKKCQ